MVQMTLPQLEFAPLFQMFVIKIVCMLYVFIYFLIICTLKGPHQPLAAPSNLLK